jgi:hypothetical protein
MKYLRQLVKRHPDLFLHSLQSMQAKVKFLKENLNRKPEKEDAFPLLLHFNYSQVIKPRCQVLMTRKNFDFNLAEAFKGTDDEFCKKYGVEPKTLHDEKRKNKLVEEQDKLWLYVPGV